VGGGGKKAEAKEGRSEKNRRAEFNKGFDVMGEKKRGDTKKKQGEMSVQNKGDVHADCGTKMKRLCKGKKRRGGVAGWD